MKMNKEKGVEKKACHKTSKFVAFALGGLAVGAAAYYLFYTDEGKKTLSKAATGVNDLSKSLKAQAEEGLHRATILANRAKEEYHKAMSLVQEMGSEVLDKAGKYKDKASDIAEKGLDNAHGLKKEAKDYAKKALGQMEEMNRQAKEKIDKV